MIDAFWQTLRELGRVEVHTWLDSWSGVGLMATGMERQGWDLQLTE
jgi:hypothetical protein